MHLASLKGNVSPIEMTEIITLYRIPEGGRQGILTTTIRPFPALLHRYVKLIRKKARQICCGKGLQFRIVIRLDRVHIIIRHLAGGIHRYLLKCNRTGTINIVMLCLRDLIITGAVGMRACGLISGISHCLSIKHPEGNIDSLDLLNMIS